MLAISVLFGCDLIEEPPQHGPGEIDPTYGQGPDLASFEAGPIEADVLEELREAACIHVVVEPETPPPTFEFIIDVSGSMSLTPPEGTESKWVLARESLRESVDELPEDASLGVVYFPNKDTEPNCLDDDVPCTPGTTLPVEACLNTDGTLPLAPWGGEDSPHRAAFENALARVNPAGGTPTHDALLFGLEQLREDETNGQRLIVLLTDGQPTYLQGCRGSGNLSDPVDPSAIIETISEAAEEGIATFVVGAPGSEETSGSGEDARTWLSDAAVAGMTAEPDCSPPLKYCHHDLSQGDDFGDSLQSALSSILAQSKSCNFVLPDPPSDQPIKADEVNVLLLYEDGDGLIVGQSADDCEEDPAGYVLTRTDDEIGGHLCPESCEAYRESLTISLELILGCEAAPVPPPT